MIVFTLVFGIRALRFNFMKEIWARIEKWLAVNAPKVLEVLEDGATDKEIQDIETALKVELPEDFIESYKIHNGIKAGFGFIEGWDLHSLDSIISEWKIWEGLEEIKDFESTPDEGIKNNWFNSKWVPFTSDGAGDSHCLDLDPDKGGNIGQVLILWHDDATRPLVAKSFTEFLSNFANDLEAGKYSVSKYGLELNN